MTADEPVDVLVVGAGPSGGVVAHTLASRGFSVVCLEQGDWVNPSDYPGNAAEWELLVQRRWHHDPNVRRLPSDYPLDVTDSDLSPVMYNAVGGSTIFYGAEWPRLAPSDFRVATLDGVAADWPISYRDLAPFHDRVDAFMGVSGVGGDPAFPPGLDYPQPPHPLGRVGRKAAAACNSLGWHWWPGANAIPTYRHGSLEACVRWGTCEWGCPHGAKASADLAFWPEALKAGAQLRTGARVQRLVTTPQGLVDGAEWIDRDGRTHLQRAAVVVLCANGVGTARLLLLSASGSHPDGLANGSGMVGRNLMLHPNCSVAGYYDEDLESHLGPAGQLLYSLQFHETDLSRGFVRGAKLHVLPLPGPLNALENHRQRPFEELWGEPAHAVTRRHGGGILWAANTEDLPEDHNRVELDPVLTDSDGIPAPKVSYRISDNTRRILRFAVERMTELHEAAGAAEVFPVELWTDQPGHLLGTARMGHDPATSVVDATGRAHEVPNLYIADGSVFVTSGTANPTSTITASALRIATMLADRAGDQKVPA